MDGMQVLLLNNALTNCVSCSEVAILDEVMDTPTGQLPRHQMDLASRCSILYESHEHRQVAYVTGILNNYLNLFEEL